MFMAGIDPHERSHTAVALDCDGAVIATVRVDANRMNDSPSPFERDRWLSEHAHPETFTRYGAEHSHLSVTDTE